MELAVAEVDSLFGCVIAGSRLDMEGIDGAGSLVRRAKALLLFS